MRHKLFRKSNNSSTLFTQALDKIILSTDPNIIKSVFSLSPMILEELDKRCLELEDTKEYKKRFKLK